MKNQFQFLQKVCYFILHYYKKTVECKINTIKEYIIADLLFTNIRGCQEKV